MTSHLSRRRVTSHSTPEPPRGGGWGDGSGVATLTAGLSSGLGLGVGSRSVALGVALHRLRRGRGAGRRVAAAVGDHVATPGAVVARAILVSLVATILVVIEDCGELHAVIAGVISVVVVSVRGVELNVAVGAGASRRHEKDFTAQPQLGQGISLVHWAGASRSNERLAQSVHQVLTSGAVARHAHPHAVAQLVEPLGCTLAAAGLIDLDGAKVLATGRRHVHSRKSVQAVFNCSS